MAEAIAAINLARQNAGLLPVTGNVDLIGISQSWAMRLAKFGILMHGNFGERIGAVFPNRACGECVAEGQKTATIAVRTFLADPAHRDIVLGAHYTICGVGVASGATANRGFFWVIDFVQ